MNALLQTYESLLADISVKSGFSEIRGLWFDLDWVLNVAPKLEKQVLGVLEGRRSAVNLECPACLSRLMHRAFDSPEHLRWFRQLLLFCYKAAVPHETTKTEHTYQTWFDTNNGVGEFAALASKQVPAILQRARRHVHSVLYGLDHKGISPMHGPGASTTPKAKWKHRYLTIDNVYAYSDWYYLQNRSHLEEYEDLVDMELIEAKLIAVPKDSRGPRLICVHPAEAIWLQQGLRVELERVISRHRSSPGIWPKGRVHFDDQSVNGRLALESSLSRQFATIDLKEASDRVSDWLVQNLFGSYYKPFGCCRAQKIRIADGPQKGTIVDAHCYAPMGNATTFPVQSLVFWAISVAAMQINGFHQPDLAYVFGDDIIVPTEAFECVTNALESCGMLVNREKSFVDGFFRESCGVDAFKGVDVTPLRWKMSVDAGLRSELQSLSDLGQRLLTAGYFQTAACVYGILRRRLKLCNRDLFYTNNPDHGSIAQFTPLSSQAWKDAYWHKSLQKYVSPVYRFQDYPSSEGLRGWNHVLESILVQAGFNPLTPKSGARRLRSADVPRRQQLNRGWTELF